ncbi:PREDICTED: uncharacterized protein LOC108759423 [Trachymyrmex cornetzi]|uniref:uncharacterized protein LOC108759423 n=1 Tax=Trachymyrmex cornetzi TaxID=471704 RepID=UPI00084EE69C|nr:PREDICTED: uncharacterized protein LOC108759423 [Trachymyrmex cornetzi]
MGITLNLTDNQITDLAHFMGRHEKIHMEIYRIVKDITEVSQLLEAAQGVRDAANNLIEESDSENEIDNSIEITANKTFNKIDYLQQSSDSSLSTPTYKKRTKTEIKAVKKKRRSEEVFVVPVKRTTWTEEEKRIVLEKFEEPLRSDVTITGKEMQDLIFNSPCLAKRTVPQMRI